MRHETLIFVRMYYPTVQRAKGSPERNTVKGRPRGKLVKTGNKAIGKMNGVAPVYFEIQSDGKDNSNCHFTR